jgi:hypothetical protein
VHNHNLIFEKLIVHGQKAHCSWTLVDITMDTPLTHFVQDELEASIHAQEVLAGTNPIIDDDDDELWPRFATHGRSLMVPNLPTFTLLCKARFVHPR